MNRISPKEELAQKMPLIEKINAASLEELIDWSLETYNSDANKARINNPNQRKFIIYIGRTVYGKLLNFTQPEFFEQADKSVAAQLREKLFVHYVLEEDTPFNLNVGVDLGTALEATLFGLKHVYPETADPTYENRHLLDTLEDYKQLPMPDFYKSGWMPEAHRLYNEINEISKGRLDVYFPGWARGPWSMATILRGFSGLFEDVIDDEDAVADFLMFIADARIHFEKQRCKFLGITPDNLDYRWTYCSYRLNYNSDCFEDEVDGGLFSRQMNHDVIIPAQRRLSEFYGGLSYYHSCGSLVNFVDDIASLNIRRYQHISPASFPAYAEFDRLLAPEVIAQISLRSTDVIGIQDEAKMANILTDKMDHLNGRRAEICADALFAGGWELIENVMRWRNVFRDLNEKI